MAGWLALMLIMTIAGRETTHELNVFQIMEVRSILSLFILYPLIRANGGGDFERREFPEERKRIDIGDFVTDDGRFRELTGWAPRVDLDDGLARSLKYYRRHLTDYL